MMDRSHTAPNVDMKSFEGKTLRGSYLLEKYLGGGNFGAVFKSQQYFLGIPVRRVAVKVGKHTGIDIDKDKDKDIINEAFLLAKAMDEMTDAEARSHLVHVYDVGILPEETNRAFLVTEFVQGTDLAAQLESYHRVPVGLLLKWVRQICRALQGLHTLVPPTLHRDLKPDNILLGIDRNVRIVDFGLAAKLLHHGYVPGVAGTITYMAPETSYGEGESVPASDVYSVGLILYEGLTGQLPFAHLIPPLDLPEALHSDWLYKQKRPIRPTPPSSLNNTVTRELDAAVLRCLEFNPSKRFRHAGKLLEALDLASAPPPDPPDVVAMDEGHHLKTTGSLDGARLSFERGLSAPSSSKETRFALLRELGEVLAMLEEYKAAGAQLVEAWELVRNTAILRTREERAELLEQIEDAYRQVPNPFQANRYKDLKDNERRGR